MKKMTTLCVLAGLTALQLSAATLTIKDNPVTEAVIPIGINFRGHSYYSPPKLKISYQENFEGTDYRQCHKGLLEKDGFTTAYAKKSGVDKWWPKLGLLDNFYPGAKVTVLSGSAKGQTTTIKELSFQDYSQHGRSAEPFLKFIFETPLDLSGGEEKDVGVLVQVDRRDEGCTGQTVGYWMGNGASLTNDVDPDGFGQSSLLLNGEQGNAFYRTPTCYQQFLDNNGTWIVRFKARLASSNAKLVLTVDSSDSQAVDLDDDWQTFEHKFDVSGFTAAEGDRKSMVFALFSASAGKVLIDDIITLKDEKQENPTVFRDDFVDSLRALNPGIIRHLMMGGAMRDFIESPIRSARVCNNITKPVGPLTARKNNSYSAGEILALAEELGAEAWMNVPGTLYPEEMDLFMEYLGGPVTTEGGKLRAEQGHPEPWTKTLKKIYIEPGNEAWNTMFSFLAGGFNGPDYWQDLFSRVKESPYYRPNVLCMAAGQSYASWMSEQIIGNTPAADLYAIAPYQVHGLKADVLESWTEKQELFRWALAYPFYSLKYSMPKQAAVSKSTGVEFAVYEASWHITGEDVRAKAKNHDPKLLEWVNSFVSSVPAALGHFNHLLSLMRDYDIRSQCHFTFDGSYFEIKLWGSVLNYKEGEERMRPTGLALSMINQAIFGDMIDAQVEDAPTFSATGLDIAGQRKKIGTAENPAITAYAFKDTDRRSLILFNMDLTEAQTVTLDIPKGGKAKAKLLAPANYDDNNEFENGDPSVAIKDGTLDLKDKTEITLPPASLMTLVW